MVELGLTDISAQVIEEASMESISVTEIERLKNIIRAENPDAVLVKLDDKENLGVLKNGHPTVAGLLIVGNKESLQKYVPSHEVIYLYMKNDIEYEIRKNYHQAIPYTIEDIYKHIENYNKITMMKIGLFHFEIKDFPDFTHREAILKALLHREYSKGEAVFIKQFRNRLEVSNPGGFISGITPDNILRQDSRPRNRHLAEILRKIGLIEKAGMGVKRMFYTQLASGKQIPNTTLLY